MTGKNPTIAEVAELAGVSTMTVSRVINGSSAVSKKRKSLVESAIQTLNYQPNIAARHLSSAKSNLIGLMYDNPSKHYVNQFLLGAMTQCRTLGQHLVVEQCDVQNTDFESALSSLLSDGKIEGLILLPPLSDCVPLLNAIERQGLPCVRIAPEYHPESSNCVCIDDYAAAFELTNALIRMGHSAIGFIKGSQQQGASRQRLNGFLAALKQHKIAPNQSWIQDGDFSYRSGLTAAEAILNSGNRPTAIFASNDDMAAATLSVAHKLSISIPEQLSVAGFDDTDIATTIWPPLSTVKQPIQGMAQAAVSRLAKSIVETSSGEEVNPKRIVLPYELIFRDSTSKLGNSFFR